ncbi:transcription factor A, mitochondrial [Thomomys bottae]
MSILRGVWGVLRALGRSGAELCNGCGSRLCSPLSFVYFPKWFSSTSSNYPKKPMTSYLRFSQEKLPVFRAQRPDVKNRELIRQIAEAWRELPESEKKEYENAYKEDWRIYKEELHRIQEELSPTQLQSLQKEIKEKRLKRKELIRKRELTFFGKPKKTRSAYNIFIAEKFQETTGVPVKEKLRTLIDMWKNMPASQKQVYYQLFEDDKIRYDNEMKSWEERMIEVGRSDLIRKGTKASKKTDLCDDG